MQIVFSQDQIDTLATHARNNIPKESCAVLFGKIENDHFTVKDIFLTKNTQESPVNFTISNEELIKVYEEAEKRQLDVVGIFHSHPDSSAYPSLTDQKYMEINPVPWIIFSNKNEEFKAYVFDSKIISVDLTVL
ncbi:MAG: M67 family metallopeptidase [Nitrosopumilaceae archaeon]